MAYAVTFQARYSHSGVMVPQSQPQPQWRHGATMPQWGHGMSTLGMLHVRKALAAAVSGLG
jgi:hypothetical protein